jgi:hypothetical protein
VQERTSLTQPFVLEEEIALESTVALVLDTQVPTVRLWLASESVLKNPPFVVVLEIVPHQILVNVTLEKQERIAKNKIIFIILFFSIPISFSTFQRKE